MGLMAVISGGVQSKADVDFGDIVVGKRVIQHNIMGWLTPVASSQFT